MSCFCGERRDPEWKQRWGERTLTSTFETSIPLLVLVGVTLLLVSNSFYLDSKARVQQTMLNFQLFLIILTVIFILYVHVLNLIRDPRPVYNTQPQWGGGGGGGGGGSSPWVVAAAVVLLLFLVSHQSSTQGVFGTLFFTFSILAFWLIGYLDYSQNEF